MNYLKTILNAVKNFKIENKDAHTHTHTQRMKKFRYSNIMTSTNFYWMHKTKADHGEKHCTVSPLYVYTLAHGIPEKLFGGMFSILEIDLLNDFLRSFK